MFHNSLHHRPHFPDKLPVAAFLNIKPDAVDKQKRRVHSVIHRLFSALREKVRHQAVFFIRCEGPQNAPGRLIPADRNAASRHRDHRIPSPVLKKRKPCQDRVRPGGLPVGNKLSGAFRQHSRSRIGKSRRFLQHPPLPAQRFPDPAALFAAKGTTLQRIDQLYRPSCAGGRHCGKTVQRGCLPALPAPVADVISIRTGFPNRNHLFRFRIAPKIQFYVFRDNRSFRPRFHRELLRRIQILSFGDKLITRHDFQPPVPAALIVQFIPHGHCVLSRLHHNAFHHFHAAGMKTPLGIILKRKLAQIPVSVFRVLSFQTLCG